MHKVWIAAIAAGLAAAHMASGWIFPFTYKGYSPSTGADKFWSTRKVALADPVLPLIPAQLPGPMDAWAGPGPKELELRIPSPGSWRMEIAFDDIHPDAPPVLHVRAGKAPVAQDRLPKGAGRAETDEGEREPVYIHKVPLPSAKLKESGGVVTISLSDGSWARVQSISLRRKPPAWEWLAALGLMALSIYWWRVGGYPAPQPQTQENASANVWAAALGLAAMAGALILPGPHWGVFDGAPLDSMTGTLTGMVLVPALLILGAGFFRSPKAALTAAALLLLKLALWTASPHMGMALKVYDTPDEAAAGQWRRTYNTIHHPGMSAAVHRPLAGAMEFPVDWLWRRDGRFRNYPFEQIERKDRQGGQWIAVDVEAWARVPEGQRLALLTLGAVPAEVTAKTPGGKTSVFSSSPAADGFPTDSSRWLPPGNYRITARLIFTTEHERHYALAPVLAGPEGRMEDAYRAGAIWLDEASASSAGWKISAARWSAALADIWMAALLAWWGAWALAFRLREGTGGAALLAGGAGLAALAMALNHVNLSGSGAAKWLALPGLAAASAMWGWAMAAQAGAERNRAMWTALGGALAGMALWGVSLLDYGHGGWTPPGVCAVLGGIIFCRWAAKTGDEERRLEIPFLLLAGPMTFIWFIWQWRGQAYTMDLYPDLSDQLYYQVVAREIFAEGDYLHGLYEPVYYAQPGHRYVVGALHALFGHSSLAQNILDLWGTLVPAMAILAIARWARMPAVAAGGAAFLFLAFISGPFFIWMIGLGRMESTANMFQYLALMAAAESGGALGMAALAGAMAGFAFYIRIDRLGGLAMGALLAAPAAMGGFAESWRQLAMDAWRRKGAIAMYVGVIGAVMAAVILRNWALGGKATMVYSVAVSPPCLSLPGEDALFAHEGAVLHSTAERIGCLYKNYEQILAGSNEMVDRAGVAMIFGTAAAALALVFRWGALRLVPLQFGAMILGLLAPYSLAMITMPPRFSLSLLPLGVLAAVTAAWSIAAALAGRRPASGA